MTPSDIERRIIRLEQKYAEILRLLLQAQITAGRALEIAGLARNQVGQ